MIGKETTQKREIRLAGLKVTGPRVKILRVLEGEHDQHLSAEEIYQVLKGSGEDVGMATVYRVLAQFETAGIVTRHTFTEGHAVFELASNDHHDHLICLDCGKLLEFEDSAIEKLQQAVAEQRGFQLVDHSLCLYGKCVREDCENRKKPPP